MSPTVCCFPPHRQRRRWVPFHSICTCYPSSSTRTGCARHAPGAQWEHQDSYWRAALPCSSQHVFWLQWGLFFHLSSLSSTTKYNGSWTHKNVLAPDSLKRFVGMRTVSHPTLLITFFFFLLLKVSPQREGKAYFSRWKLPAWIWIKVCIHFNGKLHSIPATCSNTGG